MHDIEFFPIPKVSLPDEVVQPEPIIRTVTVVQTIYRQAYSLIWLVGFLLFCLGVVLGKVL